MDDPLLTPSLSSAKGRAANLFRPAASYVLAVFGCMMGCSLLAAINSWRIGRLAREWPIYLLCFAGGGVATYFFLALPRSGPARNLFGLMIPNDPIASIAPRVIGLLLAGLFYYMHRKLYRAAYYSNDKLDRAWHVGLGCFVFDLGITYTIIAIVQKGLP